MDFMAMPNLGLCKPIIHISKSISELGLYPGTCGLCTTLPVRHSDLNIFI